MSAVHGNTKPYYVKKSLTWRSADGIVEPDATTRQRDNATTQSHHVRDGGLTEALDTSLAGGVGGFGFVPHTEHVPVPMKAAAPQLVSAPSCGAFGTCSPQYLFLSTWYAALRRTLVVIASIIAVTCASDKMDIAPLSRRTCANLIHNRAIRRYLAPRAPFFKTRVIIAQNMRQKVARLARFDSNTATIAYSSLSIRR